MDPDELSAWRAGDADRVQLDEPAHLAPGRAGGDAALTFPDLPRLELDQLLGQLVDRAREVMATQSRLRGLLHANQMIIGDLALPVLLRRIAEAARELIGARYAALGVIALDGHLAEFVHAGMPEGAVEQIGHLPQGKGLLGALIDDPSPIRLHRITDDPRSSGFPPGHPPMHSFLGVPIRVRDEVFGNLYLTEKAEGGEFTAEDEELTKALAATAGVAIENARLYEAARSRQEWLRASAAITRRLLSVDTAEAGRPLHLIAESSREVAQADLVTVLLPADDGSDLRVEVAVGVGAADLLGVSVPLDASLAGRVFTTGEPLRVSTPNEQPGLASVASGGLDVGPVLVLPLLGSQQIHGVLTAARRSGAPAFSAEDLDMAAGFANQASVAVELAEARAEQQRAAMLDERERIAADLHDQVIQRVFAAGLSLHAVATGLGPGKATERILGTVRDLDNTVSQIRTAIFQLHQMPQAQPHGLRARLLDVATDVASALGFTPAVRFAGLLDDTVPDDVAEDLLAVLREALSNIARHAQARSAEVDVTARPDRLTLDVRDDGVGMGPSTRRSGLANLRRRAERHGGTLTLTPCKPSGTLLSWSVPTR
ncbi:GAF domain-containing protein [Pseudonocardia bannensis]|uniref:sensor histidine kinase n=1 Tax=Pseudonocardia bannensis TaxID=630973 RepID=UPI001B7CE600|nr:GAF domain-containing protein [Pseudonocardia bannensis]